MPLQTPSRVALHTTLINGITQSQLVLQKLLHKEPEMLDTTIII